MQMLRRLPGQVASGDWVAAVRWDSSSAAPRPRLLLDLNDAALTFRCCDMAAAAADPHTLESLMADLRSQHAAGSDAAAF